MTIDPTTGVDNTLNNQANVTPIPGAVPPKPALSSSITPLNVNLGGSAPAPTTTDVLNTPQTTTNGGPAINLGVVNDYRKELGNGPALEHTTTPQAPISSVSNVSGGLSNLQVAPNPAPVVPPKPTTNAPDMSKPGAGQAGNVWNGTDWVIQGTNGTQQSADQQAQGVLKNIYSSNNLTPDEQNYFNQNVFNTPEARASFLAKSPQEQAQYMTDLKSANTLTRNASQTADYNKTQFDLTNQSLVTQNQLDLNKMKDQVNSDANNMSVMAGVGSQGHLQSQNMRDAIAQHLSLNQQTYQAMVSTQDIHMQQLAAQYKYQNTVDSQNYNDQMSKLTKDMQDKVAALQATGELNTKSGLLQAQSFIDSTVSNGLNAMTQYSYNMAKTQEQYKAISDTTIANNKYDDSLTKTANDGFLHTAGGGIMKDQQGQPMKVNNSSGTLMTDKPITLADGTQAFVYKNPDGTMRTEKITGTTSTPIDQVTVAKYAQALSAGLVTVPDLQKLGVPMDTINQIIAQTNGKTAEAITPYQQAQIDLEKRKVVAGQTMTPYQKAQIDLENKKLAGTSSGTTGNVTPGTTTNRPDRNNNPGNVKIGDVGNGVDDQNHTIFGSAQDGYQAMVNDLTAKMTGNNSHGLGPTSTLGQLGKIYAEDPKWASNVASLSGYSTSTKLSEIDVNKLAPAIAKAEGFTGSITPDKTDAQLAAQAIMNGDQPPTTTGLYGKTLAVKAAMEKEGFNFTAANEDWQATSKHIATMNGAQFTKLTTAVNFVNESIPLLQDLNKKAEDAMSKSGISQFGKIQKSVALSGALGQDVKSAFTQLESQATEMAAELATVYKGGNSSTDKGLEQANKLFNTDWDYQTFKDNIDLVAKNIKIRQNSIKNTSTNYLGGQAQSPVTAPEQTNSTPTGTPVQFKSKSGKTYSF